MEIFLSKFLPWFFYPLGLACILIGVSVFLTRKPRLLRAILGSVLILIWVAGNKWTAGALAASLEYRYLPPEGLPEGEVIVLLGGGTYSASPPRPMVEVNGAGDRVIYTAWLYQQGVAEHILLTGGLLDWSARESTPPEDMAVLLEMMGVPREALWFETSSRNTYESAVNSARLLRQQGIERILLVTSAWHMPRSVALFEAQGLQVLPLPVDFTVTQDESTEMDLRRFILELFPTADNLALTTKMMKEYFGIWIYQLRGRI